VAYRLVVEATVAYCSVVEATVAYCSVVGATVAYYSVVGATVASRSRVRTTVEYCLMVRQVNFHRRTPSQTARRQRMESESRSENAESRLARFKGCSLTETRRSTRPGLKRLLRCDGWGAAKPQPPPRSTRRPPVQLVSEGPGGREPDTILRLSLYTHRRERSYR
jgi:hypothetical protein